MPTFASASPFGTPNGKPVKLTDSRFLTSTTVQALGSVVHETLTRVEKQLNPTFLQTFGADTITIVGKARAGTLIQQQNKLNGVVADSSGLPCNAIVTAIAAGNRYVIANMAKLDIALANVPPFQGYQPIYLSTNGTITTLRPVFTQTGSIGQSVGFITFYNQATGLYSIVFSPGTPEYLFAS